jgi:hypothetical protein
MVVGNKFSKAFGNDLEKFRIWLHENEYYLNDIVTGEEIKLEINLINFEEPSRNKLECYVKELVKYYSLVKDNEEIDDIKSMIKDFRQNKPKKTIKKIKKQNEVKKENEIKQEDTVNENNTVVEENNTVVEENNTVVEDTVVKDIIVKDDNSLNTESVCYIDTLEFSTYDLENVFGKPLKNGGKNDKHQYEWKILVITENEEIVYSIYNWMDKNGNFKEYYENEWHIASMKRCLKENLNGCICQLSIVLDFIRDKINIRNKLKVKKNDKVNRRIISNTNKVENLNKIENVNFMQLFNLTDTEPEIINIDDICF